MESNLIGLNASHPQDAEAIAKLVSTHINIKRFDEEIIDWARRALGLSADQIRDEETLNSYLPRDWSYTRMERFVEKGIVDQKPVTYHMTPSQIIERVRHLGREIHSNFWVNALFAYHGRLPVKWLIIDVSYPNEASAIVERKGMVLRIENTVAVPVRKKDFLINYPRTTRVITTDGSTKSYQEIANQITNLYGLPGKRD